MTDGVRRVDLLCSADKDGRDAVVEVRDGDRLLMDVRLDAAGLDDLIQRLATVREALAPSTPVDLAPDASVNAIRNPRWRIPDGDQHDARVLALRHPGLGWLGFLIPHDEAVRMAHWLIQGSERRLERPAAP